MFVHNCPDAELSLNCLQTHLYRWVEPSTRFNDRDRCFAVTDVAGAIYRLPRRISGYESSACVPLTLACGVCRRVGDVSHHLHEFIYPKACCILEDVMSVEHSLQALEGSAQRWKSSREGSFGKSDYLVILRLSVLPSLAVFVFLRLLFRNIS